MPDTAARTESLLLEDFVPFRLNRLADAVSLNLSEIYRDRFCLEVPEWRVLVTVGQYRGCTAQHIALSTRMHKTRVSRAVSSLAARKMVARDASFDDGREMQLCLTKKGRQVYAELVPLALDRERALLSHLSDAQRRAFLRAVTELEKSLGLKTME
jgi:DNA-binding MarR family transcriptional regulator